MAQQQVRESVFELQKRGSVQGIPTPAVKHDVVSGMQKILSNVVRHASAPFLRPVSSQPTVQIMAHRAIMKNRS